jgi:hypothetical protein
MVQKRVAQALDADGKPTVRNLAEALDALSHLGCDLEAGRVWFEVNSHDICAGNLRKPFLFDNE